MYMACSFCVHHSSRQAWQKKGAAVFPAGCQGPAERRGCLFVRKLFSRCWGGHSKSSPAISVMALRRCCLCPVMVTDDWLCTRGASRRLVKGRTNLCTHAHTNTCIKCHSLRQPLWLRVIVSSQTVVLVVIFNDYSQRGLLTIYPYKGRMIPLYKATPEHPTGTSFKLKRCDNAALIAHYACLYFSSQSSWHVGESEACKKYSQVSWSPLLKLSLYL